MIGIAVFLCLAASVATESIFMPYAVNCDELEMCHMDNFAWCLVGEKEPVIGHCDLQKRVCSGAEIDTSNSCFLPYVINCEYPRTCGRDMQPWCLQGEADAVFGHCAVQDAICDRNASVDTTDSCLVDPNSQLPYVINCEQPRSCGRDMLPWCLQGVATPVFGHCEVQDAICDQNAVVDLSEKCLDPNSQLPYDINCEQPRSCGRDMLPWCLQGVETPVFGHCEIQDAICDENAVVDLTESCLKLPYNISCEHPRTCISDMKAWCLENRSQAVYGHCALQDAICDENASVDFTESCLP